MFYKILDLPKIPQNLLQFQLYPTIIRSVDMTHGREYIKNGQPIQSVHYTKMEANEKLKNWIVDNVPGVTSDMIFLQSFTGGGTTQLIHSDILRVFALNYIIDTGGDSVTTTWYQENEQPLSRYKDPAIHGLGQANNKIIDYDNCAVLEQVQFKQHQWSLIRTDVLHDIDHMTGVRSAVSIAILPHQIDIVERLIGHPYDPNGPL
jgi:hypothetical protein